MHGEWLIKGRGAQCPGASYMVDLFLCPDCRPANRDSLQQQELQALQGLRSVVVVCVSLGAQRTGGVNALRASYHISSQNSA
jgi:hypothetical protein